MAVAGLCQIDLHPSGIDNLDAMARCDSANAADGGSGFLPSGKQARLIIGRRREQ